MPLGSLSADAAQVPATLHSRISAWLREQIASGVWPAHYRLKPEPELAAELGVSRGTLRRALSTLIAEGALVQVRGKGTFVTSTVVEPAIAQKLTSLSEDFAWRCKQAGQLASKMRFLSAPWLGILDDAAWLRHARHANAMARRLAGGLAAIPGAELLFPVEANGVFVNLPAAVLDGLRERGWRFYTFIGAGGARFMCAWDTRPESVDALLADLRTLST